jgi:hypothetical protein
LMKPIQKNTLEPLRSPGYFGFTKLSLGLFLKGHFAAVR